MSIGKPGLGRVFLSRLFPVGPDSATAGKGTGPVVLHPGQSPCGRALALALLLALVAGGAPGARPAAAAAAGGTHQQAAQTKKKPLHGQPWAFGQSEDRKDALWRRGVPAQSLKERAVGAKSAQAAGRTAKTRGAKAAEKGAVAGATVGKGAMDTGGGINSALSAAESAGQAGGATQAAKPKGSLGLSMENETTTWNVTPMREAMRPDEVLARDSRHVVRAYADMEPTEDLSISVGPELILKDEQHGAESAGSSQPDSALGLGMQFKLDF